MPKRTRLFRLDAKDSNDDTQNNSVYKMPELMEKFINYKKAQGMSERTIADYEKNLGKFVDSMDSDTPNFEFIKEAILDFFVEKASKAPATYNVPFSNLNAFFNWLVDVERIMEVNPLKLLKLKKKKDEGRAINIEPNVIKSLLAVTNLKTYAGLRDYAVILLTLDTGIRPKEAFSVKEADIDFTYHTIKVHREIAKTRTSRTLPVSPQIIEVLKKLITVKPDDWENYIFCTSEGYRMTVERWEKRLQDYSQKIGYKVTPYDLRHTFALLYFKNSGNVFALQQILGHADIKMAKRYVSLSVSDIKAQHLVSSPINQFVKRTTRLRKIYKE